MYIIRKNSTCRKGQSAVFLIFFTNLLSHQSRYFICLRLTLPVNGLKSKVALIFT